ncbi:MAG TPA: hypothetical protein VHK28_08255, partial [Candidatus Limnocylindria bacterium]|nr:hypothetical protein [Candidatus Limnocylindria bacterium]
MSGSKRPSTSSLRRFITSRPYVTVAELRRRFALDDPEAMAHIRRNGTAAWIGLPDREASKVQDLWERDEVGVELSVEVRAPVVVGIYPRRIARYVTDGGNGDVTAPNGNGAANDAPNGIGEHTEAHDTARGWQRNREVTRGHLPRYPGYRRQPDPPSAPPP